jgi:methylmalonyl-CoA mutase C-terminal domain/subunit
LVGVIASRKDNATMDKLKKRILLCKWALDAHDRGVKTIAKVLVGAGYEVIFTRFEAPLEAVKTAEDEDVDVIGVSCSMGEHRYFAPEILRLLEDRKMADIPLIFGGVIPPKDAKDLFRLGVSAVFGPGTSLEEVSRYITGLERKRKNSSLP